MKFAYWPAALSIALAAGSPSAQQAVPKSGAKPVAKKAAQGNPMDAFIEKAFKLHEDDLLCPVTPFSAVRSNVIAQLKANGVTGTASDTEVLSALYTRFPCPFSPYRAELRPATAADVAGAWVSPAEAQPYRFAPKSPLRPATLAEAIKCEAVGYFDGGEYRTGAVLGSSDCPFSKAADLEPARSRPKVASWSMVREGRARIERSDVKDYFEEWDIYAVTAPFRFETLALESGDLVAYKRAATDQALNAATEFRHLRRLK